MRGLRILSQAGFQIPLWALLLVCGSLYQLSAQSVSGRARANPASGGDTIPSGRDSASAGAERSLQQQSVSTGGLLEGPVNRSEYVLGPSDVLTLWIFSFRSELHSLTITPEGTVVIPSIGVVRVAGLNIDAAEREVSRRVRRFYQDADVSLSLAAVRSFKVFLVGEVPNPGARSATAVTRVSEVIPSTNAQGIIHRNVVVRRSSGRALRVDLARFLHTGDLTQNPFLREGDVIYVPTVDETVSIRGQVAFPGAYEYRPGETLADLVQIANGGSEFRSDAADTLRLMRFTGASRGEIKPIARADVTGAEGRKLVLEPFDALFVPRLAHYRQRTTATIDGEVRRPGTYPILPDVTTVRELVEMAGGFTPRASLLDAVLRRQPVWFPSDSVRRLEDIAPEMLSRDERRILQVTSRADDKNVVVDFDRLYTEEGAAYDLPLEDGDLLYIPERRSEITVLGAVAQPGIVTFEPGQSLEYFVRSAGGYTQLADKREVVVIKAKSGNRLYSRDLFTLEPGDRIIVPFRERRTALEKVQTVQGVISTVSGFVLTIIGLERLWDTITN